MRLVVIIIDDLFRTFFPGRFYTQCTYLGLRIKYFGSVKANITFLITDHIFLYKKT